MTYHGQVKAEAIVLGNTPDLPEGAEVQVEVLDTAEQATTLGQRLMKYAGQAKGLPPDLAKDHDHYLHGTPKK
jgi:hypothetical protein